MNGSEDRDLEERFRRISTSLETRVPDSLYDYASEVTETGRGKTASSLDRSQATGRSRFVGSLGVAAAAIVAIVLAGFVVSIRPAGPAASGSAGASVSLAACGGSGGSVLAGASSSCSTPAAPSVSATPGSSVSDSASPTVAVSPTSGPVRSPGATMIASGFTTAGVASGWSHFSWTSAGTPLNGYGQVLQWSGGYIATESPKLGAFADSSPGLWTSVDGQTWTAARGISDDAAVVSVAPAGLVAIGFNGDPADQTLGSAWSSPDGRNWTELGRPDFPGSLISIAGTSSGIVATVEIMHGTGKSQYGSFQIEFSTDGLHWTAENVSPGLASAQVGYGEPPHVQTHAGQFYLMGSAGPATPTSFSPPDEIWLSGDGKTWTKSAGGYSSSGLDADYIDFGRDGMILHTDAYGAAPGATGLAYSSDGGQTWHEDTNYAPLGPTTCQGECSNGEDGVIGANGTYFVAVKNGGKKAWLSYDGQHWSSIAWTGGDPTGTWYGGNGFLVMPRGVLLADSYGAAS